MRIRKLEQRYSEYNFAKDEIVSPEYRKTINQKYRKTEQRNHINSVLTEVHEGVRIKVKNEVHEIFKNITVKELCYNCKFELIVAVVILYVWKIHYPKLREETTKIWNKYDVTWRKYALIMRKLLLLQRENNRLEYREDVTEP